MAKDPTAPVTRAEFDDLFARQMALLGIVKVLFAESYGRDPRTWESWLMSIHDMAAGETDPARQRYFDHLVRTAEMLISTPRDPELRA